MKLSNKLVLAALSLSLVIKSQSTLPEEGSVKNKRGCGTAVPSAEWDAWFNKKVQEFKDNRPNGKVQSISVTIPVIVHVLHGGANPGVYPNISAAQIRSQIDVLNKDYAGNGFNSYKLASTGFAPVGVANTNITFCLAQLDPSGNTLAEAGIDRVNWSSAGFTNPATPTSISAFQSLMDNSIKPNTIWDPTSYFNIWVSDVNSNVDLLGYATFPGGSTLAGLSSNIGNANTDGIWVWSRSFGNTGTLQSPYNLGRTATHETGHWLGLRHIGGDGNGNSAGDCNATDYCDDTPAQKGGFGTGTFGQNFGAPTYPLHANACSSTFGDMFMNFMDYTDDAINYMFSPDQSTRMQTALANGYYRNMLSTSSETLCSDKPIADFLVDSIACFNSAITPENLTSEGSLTPTYTWSVKPATGVTFAPASTNANPAIQFPSTGYYTITVVVSNSIGVSSNTLSLRLEDCTGLKENTLSGSSIRLIPNPTNGLVSITTDLNSTKELQLSIYNALGEVILSRQFAGTDSKLNLDLSSYPNGVYTVSISNGADRIVKRLILTK